MDHEQAEKAGRSACKGAVPLEDCDVDPSVKRNWQYGWLVECGRRSCEKWVKNHTKNFLDGFHSCNQYSQNDFWEGAFFIGFRERWNEMMPDELHITRGWTLDEIGEKFPPTASPHPIAAP